MKLLTRTQFREGCLNRDGHKCVICGATEDLSVHHIIERRLWDDGGYYMDNGSSLCEKHHIEAEITSLSCEDIREACGIEKTVLPDSYYSDSRYSKWGDVILPNGMRMKGPVFYDGSVQKILTTQLHLYTDYIKYPRTYHLPWSEGRTSDDKTIKDCSMFEGKEVVVTEKLDGENTSIYNGYCHARSIDGRNHWSRSWVKNLQSRIGYEIPESWRICGENLYAKHSIKYDSLESYFYAFSIWDDTNQCLSWKETQEYCSILKMPTVPVLYEGIWDKTKIKALFSEDKRETMEGYVVRVKGEFPYRDFSKSVAKFVRKEHVGTAHHWFFTASEKNEIK